MIFRALHNVACRSLYFIPALVLLLAGSARLMAQTETSQESDAKAAFLYNFCQFVEWPAGTFSHDSCPLVIGVMGNDRISDHLNALVQREKVKGRSLVIKQYRSVDEVDECHVLFISDSEPGSLRRIFKKLGERSILTVGDATEFARSGGMIRLLVSQDKIRLEVNPSAAKSAGLTISSKLLRQAAICCE